MWACAIIGFHLSPQEAWDLTFPELRFLFEWQSKQTEISGGHPMTMDDLEAMERRLLKGDLADG